MGWIQNRVVAVFSAAVAAASMSFVVDAGPAGATDFGPVDPTIADGDTDSLRDILENQVGDGDVVILQAGATYVLDSNDGDIDIDAAVTIQGNGATIRQTVANSRVLDTEDNLTLIDVTITGGREDSDGGGVRVDDSNATLTVQGSALTDNATVGTAQSCGNDGGAIEADGALVIRNSTLSNNSACDDGGAFDHNSEFTDATVVASTLSGNCAEDDGGASDSDGDQTMVNSTVTGNTEDDQGALAVDADAGLTLVYSDVVQNTHTDQVDCPNTTAPAAAAAPEDPPDAPDPDDVKALDADEPSNLDLGQGDLFAFGSVVALPLGTDAVPFNCSLGSTTSSGFNFSDDDTCEFTNTAQGDRENAGDPGLAALASNGGPTQTRLPQQDSPLVNFIPIPSCGGGNSLAGFAVTTDQRGVSRPQETGCEIGSVEIEPPVPPEPVPAVPALAAPTAVPVEPRFTG
jgi:hypothetical protein